MLTQPTVPVFETGFAKGWSEIAEGVSRIRLNAKCGACKWRLLCRSCAACAYWETGAYDSVPEYMCRYTEETYRLLEEYLNKSEAFEATAS